MAVYEPFPTLGSVLGSSYKGRARKGDPTLGNYPGDDVAVVGGTATDGGGG